MENQRKTQKIKNSVEIPLYYRPKIIDLDPSKQLISYRIRPKVIDFDPPKQPISGRIRPKVIDLDPSKQPISGRKSQTLMPQYPQPLGEWPTGNGRRSAQGRGNDRRREVTADRDKFPYHAFFLTPPFLLLPSSFPSFSSRSLPHLFPSAPLSCSSSPCLGQRPTGNGRRGPKRGGNGTRRPLGTADEDTMLDALRGC